MLAMVTRSTSQRSGGASGNLQVGLTRLETRASKLGDARPRDSTGNIHSRSESEPICIGPSQNATQSNRWMACGCVLGLGCWNSPGRPSLRRILPFAPVVAKPRLSKWDGVQRLLRNCIRFGFCILGFRHLSWIPVDYYGRSFNAHSARNEYNLSTASPRFF